MDKNQGKLIVIEGSDGSGKATQVELLKKALVGSVVFDFPRYEDNIYDALIKRYLNGEFGSEVSPYFASLPFAMDRLLAKPEIEQALKDGKIVLCNRYTASNKAHMGANLPENERNEFIVWLDKIEYETNKLPRPNLTIFLNVPPKIGQRNISNRDIHEQSIKHLLEANKIYQELAKEPNWVTIECTENGQMKLPEEIHRELLSVIHGAIGI